MMPNLRKRAEIQRGRQQVDGSTNAMSAPCLALESVGCRYVIWMDEDRPFLCFGISARHRSPGTGRRCFRWLRPVSYAIAWCPGIADNRGAGGGVEFPRRVFI